MATTIVTKNSSTAAAVPTAAQLVQGELAVNVADKRLYTEDSVGGIVELGTNPSAEIVANGGIALPDNGKVTFGAGDDLQIYHDGSNSIIKDGGTGNLNILAGQLRIKNPTDAESLIEADVNGAVRLYHNNVEKLATTSTGIDVTGTATMDGLSVSDSQAGGVTAQIVNSNPTQTGGSRLDFLYSGNTVTGRIQNRFNGADFQTDWYTGVDGLEIFTDLAKTEKRLDIANNGDISFYEDTGTTAKLTWDASAEMLTTSGLTVETATGTATPTPSQITIATSSAGGDWSETDPWGRLAFYSADTSAGGAKEEATLDVVAAQAAGGVSDFFVKTYNSGLKNRIKVGYEGDVSFYEDTGTTAKLFWDASAEFLGIGTTAPTVNGESLRLVNGLYLNGGGTEDVPAIGLGDTNSGLFGSTYVAVTTQGQERFRVDTGGNVGIGTDSPTQKLHVDSGEVLVKSAYDAAGTTNSKIYFATRQSGNWRNSYIGNTGNDLTFATGGTGTTHTNATERMRIDSSGNLLVGKSGTNFGAAGIELHSADQIYATSTTHGLALNRLSTDGAIAKFYKDGTTVGSIGVALSDNLYFSGVDAGIGCGTNAIYPATTTGQASPNDTDLGTPSTRFRDLYLSGKVNIASGNIGGSGGPGYDVYISSGTGTNGNGLRCTNYISTNAALPCRGDGASTDNVMDLGTSGTRFRNLYLSGGVHLGGIATANKLDDYEEGTWTPTITGSTSGSATLTINQASYTKVGRAIHVSCYIINANVTGLVGTITVGGLPFTANGFAMTKSGYSTLFSFDQQTIEVAGYTENGAAYIRLQKGSSITGITGTDATAAGDGRIMMNFTYQTS